MLIITLNVTTDAAGNGQAISDTEPLKWGRLYAVQLVDGTFDDLVDVTLTAEEGELSIPLLTKADWNTDQMVYPRVLEALNTDGTALTTHTMPLVVGKPKAVVAQGGNTKSGSFKLYIIE